jgi:hypothetical protein
VITEKANGGTARVLVRNDRFLTNPLTPIDADRNVGIQPLDALLNMNAIRRIGRGEDELAAAAIPTTATPFDLNLFNRQPADMRMKPEVGMNEMGAQKATRLVRLGAGMPVSETAIDNVTASYRGIGDGEVAIGLQLLSTSKWF